MKTNTTQPTAGAMRAAKALFKEPRFFTSDAKSLAERKAHYWTGKAQIIDRETGVAELVAELEHAETAMANLRGDLLAGREINRKECAYNLLLNCERFLAALAKAKGQP